MVLGAHLLALVGAAMVAACGGVSARAVDESGPGGASGMLDGSSADPPGTLTDVIRQTQIDKIDLLFVIDNSPSMADKREILQQSIPDLLSRVMNPACRNPWTGEETAPPASNELPCPPPFVRARRPIRDLHVGVISSSLGSYGTAACAPDPKLQDPTRDEEQDDGARMIGARPRAIAAGLGLADQAEGTPGFLIWDTANGKQQDMLSLLSFFAELMKVTGANGCGYEAPLEAWYRFLVDPAPPAGFVTVPCPGGGDCVAPQGIDEHLLAQRRAFLRSDSLLAIVMVTDENDCSIQAAGQLYDAARDIALPKATSACAENPNDPCCTSCGAPAPDGCPAPDPGCDGEPVPSGDDSPALRCWKQKQRFGVDFLYPVERYVNALSRSQICSEKPSLSLDGGCVQPAANPVFQDLSGQDGRIRPPSLVYLAGIVGVPWQDIAADVDDSGKPWGPLDTSGDGVVDNLHFLTPLQMSGVANDGVARDVWADVIGHPEGTPPSPARDPLMVESIEPRVGTNPATGAPLAGPDASPWTNPVNGHERLIPGADDLQYACVFPLPAPKDCTVETGSCDCGDGKGEFVTAASTDDPVCQASDGSYGSSQYSGKAYPSPRILEVLRDLQDQSIVASVCPAVTDAALHALPSYGYRPALEALTRRLSEGLQGKCLGSELELVSPSDGPARAACTVLELTPAPGRSCDRPGRQTIDASALAAAVARLAARDLCGGGDEPSCDTVDWTGCEITPTTADVNGDGTIDCGQEGVPITEAGWCYVDPARGLGDPALADKCPPDEQRLLRFVDPTGDTPASGATVLVTCRVPS